MFSNKKRRIIALLCSLSLAISIPCSALAAGTDSTTTPPEPPSDMTGAPGSGDTGTTPAMPSVTFSDVSESDWFYDAVNLVSSRGIMTGSSGSFYPNNVTTRAEFISYLYAAAGSPSVTAASTSVTDVSPADSYYNAVIWAEENKIVEGTSTNLFEPNTSLNREMAMTFLYRAANELKLILSGGDTSSLASFSDGSSVDSWASEAVAALVAAGVITGDSDGKLAPTAELTNAQVAAMLARVMKSTMGTLPGGGGPGSGSGEVTTGGTSVN